MLDHGLLQALVEKVRAPEQNAGGRLGAGGEHEGLFRGVLEELTGDGVDPTYVMPPERSPPTRRRNDIVFFFFNSGKLVWRRRLATIPIHHEVGLLVVICGHGNRQRSSFLSPEEAIFEYHGNSK